MSEKENIDVGDIYRPVKMEYLDVGFRRIPEQLVEGYTLDMDPDYQREHVWTLPQKEKYVGFILQGGRTMPIVINVKNGYGNPAEIVDGKQRVTAICEWLEGDIEAELYDGKRVHVDQFKHSKKNWRLLGMNLPVKVGIVKLDREGVLDYYLRLNNGGTVHEDSEIERVREILKEERENA